MKSWNMICFTHSYANTTSATVLIQHLAHEHRVQVSSDRIEVKQRKLSEVFTQKKKEVTKGQLGEKFIFARRLLVWFCRDLLPFNVVSKPGFLDFFKSLNRKGDDIPSRTTISNMALDDMFSILKKKLISNLKETQDHCCISFDMWTDNYRRISYITYTCHYITSEWKLQSRVLKTSMFEHPHTCSRIAENFHSMISEYAIEQKEIIAITDEASNVIGAVDQMGLKRIPCIAHKINRLIQYDLLIKGQDIDEVTEVIRKVRRIQKALLFSYGALIKIAKGERQRQVLELLEEITNIEDALDADERFSIQELTRGPVGVDGLKSISNVRWNCIHKICSAHFKNADIVRKCLEQREEYDLILTRSEIKLLERLADVLDVFNTFTKYIQGNSYPTLNSLILFYVEIKQGLEQIQRRNICEIISKVVDILLKNLDHRFELTDLCVAAAVLDPSTQHLPLIDTWLSDKEFSREQLLQRIVTEFKIKLPNTSISIQSDIQPQIDPAQPSNDVQNRNMTLREKLLTRHVPIRSTENSIDSELNRLHEVRDIYNDALDFWLKFGEHYPNLSTIAKVLFSIQATTATAESSFSFAGNVIKSQRATIDPFKVEKVLFIHDNYDLLTL
ncbi:zinc finger BED domain-containing protein DAYSLEEPER-like [Contarinia nasturtii]|uniref:zinc finger BED domain-containing protein DAYSLEEPER-like n=1 Tax=Contarinia nasturtii TaxID=265458 RepID=UPI0012D3795E|nr:zinc finger BED domain-containing protein DAYSLEEPER-like [Contarinia nasturtii]